MIGFQMEPGLQQSWLTGAVSSAALVTPVIDARMVNGGDEETIRMLRDLLESVFKQWRDEYGIFPQADGGLLGSFNIYDGKTLAECPPYTCMGNRWADYADLLAKLTAEQYPPLVELETMANGDNLRDNLPDNIPRLPPEQQHNFKYGMQRILAALILSEAAAGRIESATKAHWELSRIRDENERRIRENMRAGEVVIHALAITGAKFKQGRKVNTVGPIRKAIARELKKNPDLMPRHLWEILASKPPKGWEFFDNSAGKYIEGPKGGDGMGYARFSEVCKEEKDKLSA